MAPMFKDDEIVNNLNFILFNDDDKISISNIKNPTSEFTREIIVSALNEAGFRIGSQVHLPAEMSAAMSSGIDITEYLTPLQLMVSARKFFNDLVCAAGEKLTDETMFGFNDLVSPEARRLRFFLCHFINYWLLCNNLHNKFTEVTNDVEKKAMEKIELEEAIEGYKVKNNDLRKNKASAAMKGEKLREKIDHDKNMLNQLTEDVKSLGDKVTSVKDELSSAVEKEAEHLNQIKALEKNEFRLKTISKADETKQELETQLETLKSEEEGKLYQVKNYQHKADKMDEEEAHLKEAISNLQVTKDLNSQKKKSTNEKKTLMADCTASHEKLSSLETQLMARHRSYETLKNEISNIKAKWEKNKGMMENDLVGYTEKLSKMTKDMTEDDMVSHELDSKISETMYKTEEIKESIKKEKETTEKLADKLFIAYDNFMRALNEDHERLKNACEEMKNIKPKY